MDALKMDLLEEGIRLFHSRNMATAIANQLMERGITKKVITRDVLACLGARLLHSARRGQPFEVERRLEARS